MKTNRELQFLTYLSALEAGDAEGIMAFLALAEADAELEQMMLDHHQAEEPEEKSKVITPFKRKREDVNRWWGRFGTGLVAAIAMIFVGTAGLIIGARSQNNVAALSEMLNPSQDPNALTTPNDPAAWSYTCQAEIVQNDNTIQLLAGGDIDRDMVVGVNNPFLLLLNASRANNEAGYEAVFEGLRVVVARDSIWLDEACERLSSIQVLPKDNAYKTCEMEIFSVYFPLRDNNGLLYPSRISNWVVLDAPAEGYFPIDSMTFSGRIPAEAVYLNRDCTTYPLLYAPDLQNDNSADTLLHFDAPVLALDSLRITEQSFEHGNFFYIEAVEQLWVVFDYPEDLGIRDAWYISSATNAWDTGVSVPIAPTGFFPPKTGLFEFVWASTGFANRDLNSEELGWAVSEAITYDSPYDYSLLAGNYRIHMIEDSTGTSYSFYERGHRWELTTP